MPNYIFYPTKHFTIKLEKIKRKDPGGHNRIQDIISRLLENPQEADGRMIGIHHGRFKKYVGRKDYRVIYYFCELCRKMNKRLEERCDHCEVITDNSVIFFDVYHKNDKNNLKDRDI